MYTVTLTTHGCTRHYPCSSHEDMQVLRAALIHKYGDLQVEVRRLLTSAANEMTLSETRPKSRRKALTKSVQA